VVSFSLLEITQTLPFAVIFGIGFIILALALAWRIYHFIPILSQKIFMLILAFTVLISGIASFFLLKQWFPLFSSAMKIPLYAILGISFSFSLTFTFSEFISIGVCDKLCRTRFISRPLFGNSKLIFSLFGVAMLLGATYGVLFGILDVENDSDERHTKLWDLTFKCIPMGAIVGFLFGLINQIIRLNTKEKTLLSNQQRKQNEDNKL